VQTVCQVSHGIAAASSPPVPGTPTADGNRNEFVNHARGHRPVLRPQGIPRIANIVSKRPNDLGQPLAEFGVIHPEELAETVRGQRTQLRQRFAITPDAVGAEWSGQGGALTVVAVRRRGYRPAGLAPQGFESPPPSWRHRTALRQCTRVHPEGRSEGRTVSEYCSTWTWSFPTGPKSGLSRSTSAWNMMTSVTSGSTCTKSGSQAGRPNSSHGPISACRLTRSERRARSRRRSLARKPDRSVEIGCQVGLGRTGTVLACMAVLAGIPDSEAVSWVREHYKAGAVETSEQEAWVRWFAQRSGDLPQLA
jgi:hypothetical protein